jgi:hypothetical protein
MPVNLEQRSGEGSGGEGAGGSGGEGERGAECPMIYPRLDEAHTRRFYYWGSAWNNKTFSRPLIKCRLSMRDGRNFTAEDYSAENKNSQALLSPSFPFS